MYFTEEEYSEAKDFMAEILTDDEDECNALNNAGSCKANSKCSWCTAGAVADACHSIENAGRLPPAVFDCDPLPSFDDEEEDEEDEEEIVEEENLADDEDEMHIIAGVPVRAEVY